VDEPITPGPHAEFCNVLQERLFERLDTRQQQFTGADQIPMSGELPIDEPLERISRLHLWNCEHVQTPYELAEKGFVKPTDVPDPRHALLQFIIAATPNDAVVAEILDKHDQVIEDMTSWFEAHLVGDDDAVLVEMINNVPDTISPVKAKPVYIQLPDGDKTMLMQAWRVSTYQNFPVYWF
jgi:extracellular elastinolytic metalloproteinase